MTTRTTRESPRKKPVKQASRVAAVKRDELWKKVEMNAPLSPAEIAAFLGRSLAWVYEATTDGRLRMNPGIKRMTPEQIRADLTRGAGRR